MEGGRLKGVFRSIDVIIPQVPLILFKWIGATNTEKFISQHHLDCVFMEKGQLMADFLKYRYVKIKVSKTEPRRLKNKYPNWNVLTR